MDSMSHSKVYSIAGIDPAVINHIDCPIGTRLIRISSTEFEEDRNQPAFMEKQKRNDKECNKVKQYIIDAFTDKPFSGNPAAVCVMDKWPEEESMMKQG